MILAALLPESSESKESFAKFLENYNSNLCHVLLRVSDGLHDFCHMSS